ncbi:hypothetical protein LZ30DRAFT_714997 [Colletotrichum cereale]|nr:hypothetical protein LZ30DRAFT_714997 [Colletotrichum cereale]
MTSLLLIVRRLTCLCTATIYTPKRSMCPCRLSGLRSTLTWLATTTRCRTLPEQYQSFPFFECYCGRDDATSCGGHSSPTHPGPDFFLFLTSCAEEHRQSLQDDWYASDFRYVEMKIG